MADPTAYERLLDRLNGVRRTGDRAMARCPAHQDGRPSLSLRATEGQTLLWCFAGCAAEDVLAALGLGLADLYDEPRGATYRYDDGRTVHRSPGKRFRQSGNTTGRASLYRLSAVEKAISEGVVVALVEGEKDVHALESLGVVATTNPMGATNWHKVDPSPLHGGRIVVIPDADEAGRTWAHAVRASLAGRSESLTFLAPKVGKDPADHIAAGHRLDEFVPLELGDDESPPVETMRRIRLTPASEIKPRPVRWPWNGRIPAGEFTLTPGRGGIGKSTFHAWVVAHLTRGTLQGVHFGMPTPCIIAASEDSWARTIVPRLIAAGADMDLVYRVDVITATDLEVSISLPRDVEALAKEVGRIGAALLSVDPVMSVLANGLDSHKDADVRQALTPLARLADRTGCVVLGNAHFNKSTGSDPLTLIMASAAFGNVARAVLGFARDTDAEDQSCVISQVKNNLGRLDLPSLRYRIDTAWIDTDEGQAEVGKLVMLGESDRSVADILRDRGDTTERTERDDAKDFLRGVLRDEAVPSKDIKAEAAEAGISWATIRRAADHLGVRKIHPDIKGPWLWTLRPQGAHQESQDAHSPEGEHLGPIGEHLGKPARVGDMGVCADCGLPMYVVEAGQTVHPMCHAVNCGVPA
jgi:AAA domain